MPLYNEDRDHLKRLIVALGDARRDGLALPPVVEAHYFQSLGFLQEQEGQMALATGVQSAYSKYEAFGAPFDEPLPSVGRSPMPVHNTALGASEEREDL